ncbi:MAG: hypothetical protein ABI065_07595, partial [Terrimesophilobacter sp.]
IQIFKDLNAADPLHPTLTQQADSQATAPHLGAGAQVVWTYRVATTSTAGLSGVTVTDNNGTPATSDDFTALPILVTFHGAQYNVGDTNFDGLLEASETWLFTSAGALGAPTVAVEGWYENVGTVSARDTADVTYTASNPAWYFGDSGLRLIKAINAVDPTHPTAAEDANATGPTLPVGSTVTFSYLVSNTSGGPMSITGLVDDNGTPANAADDISLTAMTPLLGADHTHNIGDINDNGVFDTGESWVYLWATTAVLGGPVVNTATVTATSSTGKPLSATDIAQYTGVGAKIALHTAVNAADPASPTVVEDANTPPGPFLSSGSSVAFSYLVTNSGAVPLGSVIVTDNHGTATTADDFHPVYVSGDINSNGLLDVGETWLFTSAGAATLTAITGLYLDTSTVTGTPTVGGAINATDPTYYTGVPAGGILITKAVNAANPAAPTSAENANDPANPYYVAVGSPVVFSYLVSSPNTLSIAGSTLALVDDNGTPGDTTDDFSPTAVLVNYHHGRVNGSFNIGDTNHNGLLDGTEVWQYTSRGIAGVGVAAAGLHGNIGTVRVAVAGVNYVSSDPAWYRGVVAEVQIEKATNALDPLQPSALEDGENAAHELILAVGTPVVWSYLVTNPGVVATRISSVVDDQGTTNTADDFSPTYVSGDTNGNGLLDPGETWLYTSSGVVTYRAVAGQYTNTATVTATEPRTGAQAHSSDISGYLGATSSISVSKAVNALDPWHPTVREDANAAPGPVLLAGTTVTWSYLVTNTGTSMLDLTGVLDDDGTGNPNGGFAVDTDTMCAPSAPNASQGDVNNNGMLDPGETWCFTATGTVGLGQYKNTVTVTATVPGQPTPVVTATDVANLFGTAAGIRVLKYINGIAAETPSTAVQVVAGSTATFTYKVSVTTGASLADVTVIDDNGTPMNMADDFAPAYLSGDTNGNELLDPGEVWVFTAPHVVPVGAYNNVVRASGTLTAGTPAATVWDDDINYSVGVTATIKVVKAVNALDPWHPTTIEDANTAPAKELLVGTTAVWTYLIRNTGNVPLAYTSLRDDNGTPTNTADDFTPTPVTATWQGALYNAGDLNHNNIIDPGETWLFEATSIVHLGAFLNTAVATTSVPGTGQIVTGGDVAGYYGNASGEGLTPGYWKNHTTLWPTQSDGTPVFSPNQLLSSVFTGVPAAQSGETLLGALSAGGGGVIALFRAAVAGLLATTSQYISYPESSTWVIASVNAALASGNASQISSLMNTLDGWNNYEANLTPPKV